MRWTPDFPPLSLSSRKLANQTTPLTWKRWGPGPDYYGLVDAEQPPNDRRTPPRALRRTRRELPDGPCWLAWWRGFADALPQRGQH